MVCASSRIAAQRHPDGKEWIQLAPHDERRGAMLAKELLKPEDETSRWVTASINQREWPVITPQGAATCECSSFMLIMSLRASTAR